MPGLLVWAAVLLVSYYLLVELPSPSFVVHKEGPASHHSLLSSPHHIIVVHDVHAVIIMADEQYNNRHHVLGNNEHCLNYYLNT